MAVIIVNAGVTHPRSLWLDRMRPVGRLLFPLTFDSGGGLGKGDMLLVKRDRAPCAARFLGFAMIYLCTSVRDPAGNAALRKLISGG
jgi:protein-L-isoaspartate(D-aspartate) O-methyltransferase